MPETFSWLRLAAKAAVVLAAVVLAVLVVLAEKAEL